MFAADADARVGWYGHDGYFERLPVGRHVLLALGPLLDLVDFVSNRHVAQAAVHHRLHVAGAGGVEEVRVDDEAPVLHAARRHHPYRIAPVVVEQQRRGAPGNAAHADRPVAVAQHLAAEVPLHGRLARGAETERLAPVLLARLDLRGEEVPHQARVFLLAHS